MRPSRAFLAAVLLIPLALPAWSATYYVAPKNAAAVTGRDGSKSKPFSTPTAALNRAKAGDTILLLDGDYDALIVKNKTFSGQVTIRSANGKKARVERVSVEGNSSNVLVQNMSVWASNPDTSKADRVRAGNSTKDVVFDGLDVRSDKNAGSYATWTKAQWASRSTKGFNSGGTRVTVKNSTFTGFGFSAVMTGTYNKALNNTIQGFSMDAMRVLGDYSTVQGNRIVDAVRINSNHPDAIQSWSQNGKPVKGMVIADNMIIEWASKKKSPLSSGVQGIGFFDGFYDGMTIKNNTIAISAYHGISVYGGRKLSVTGNKVLNISGQAKTYPWIGIYSHKNGTPATDVTVSGNQAMKFSGKSNAKNGVVFSGNTVLTNTTSMLEGILGSVSLPLLPALENEPAPGPGQGARASALMAKTVQPGLAFTTFEEAAPTAPSAVDLGSEPAPVPLPAAGWLMVAVLGGLGLLGRRRKATA
ncbi:MAG: hypothetical protein DI533_21020 [Cereibacter sphaeroides]|uniref:Uncharacterized protein n=1 Tax=Cereibacter sphaeroides TaxID=1063 RepID=A0A2W5RYH5_CERSP|nr:MAG: hypothetical protein DI533_21020 [Cereibacter sphaeroides]